MPTIAVHLSISGRVQGVGFRAWTVRQARQRALRGWVRNRRDGRVEALLIGGAAEVEAMVEACRHGPALARVDALERLPAADDGTPDFGERPTA
jgi:acylphosphatase